MTREFLLIKTHYRRKGGFIDFAASEPCFLRRTPSLLALLRGLGFGLKACVPTGLVFSPGFGAIGDFSKKLRCFPARPPASHRKHRDFALSPSLYSELSLCFISSYVGEPPRFAAGSRLGARKPARCLSSSQVAEPALTLVSARVGEPPRYAVGSRLFSTPQNLRKITFLLRCPYVLHGDEVARGAERPSFAPLPEFIYLFLQACFYVFFGNDARICSVSETSAETLRSPARRTN